MLNKVQEIVAWPLQCEMCLMPLLAKPAGGERTVAKTPMVYRCWNRIRRGHIRGWEDTQNNSYDHARAGSSAYLAAADRGLTFEISKAIGQQAAVMLWDVHKYFDSVQVPELLQRAERTGYPALDLSLGLAMHTAPRLLQNQQNLSDGTTVNASLLAGCSQSVPLTRAYLSEAIDEVTEEPELHITTYVDDVGMGAVGTAAKVIDILTDSSIKFVRGLIKAKLKVADKSVLVASSRALAHRIRSKLSQAGIHMLEAPFARDLGLTFNLSGKRSTAGLQSRHSQARSRLLKIKSLTEVNKRARRLAAAAGLSKATWGRPT